MGTEKRNNPEEIEVWKAVSIPEYYELYEVSSYGRVRKFGKDIKISFRHKTGGYTRCSLNNNGTTKAFSVHRLVALTFIPNPMGKPHINHINGVKHDNRVENLEWCTQSENSIHAVALNLANPLANMKTRRPLSENGRARPVAQYSLNGEFIKEWGTLKEAALSFEEYSYNFRINCISSCANGLRSSAFGYCWKFESKKGILNNPFNIHHPKSKKVYQYDLDGNFLKAWENVRIAATSIDVDEDNLSECCRLNGSARKACGGFMWRYYLKNAIPPYEKDIDTIAVLQYDIQGNFIAEYKSLEEAQKITGAARQDIYKVNKGKRKTAGGYKWEYKN